MGVPRPVAGAPERDVRPPAIRSLVVAPQWIGDAVMAEPLLSALAARGERLTVGALPWVAPVFRAMTAVDTVLEWPFAHGRLDLAGRRDVARQLRGRFDRAYVLPNSLKSALIPWLARVPLRVGYRGEARIGLLNRRRPNPAGRPPMVPFYAALARLAEAHGEADGSIDVSEGAGASARPRLVLSPEAVASAQAAFGLAARPYWVFAPGAEYGPAKCWPADHYAELARRLLVREPGVPVVLIGSPKEAELAAGIAAAVAPADCRPLAGRTSLDQALALIAGARGVVSNDSGLMHVAAAFDRPQVAVFGSTSPEHTPPLNPLAQVLWLKDELALDCAPCFDRQCRYGHTRCLAEVLPDRVMTALQRSAPAP